MPQPTSTSTVQRYGPPPPSRRRGGLPAAAWPVVVVIAAGTAGVGVGLLVFHGMPRDGSDSWAELGAAIFGLVAALCTFVLAYVVGIVLAARRCFPPGGRLVPAALTLASPVALASGAAVLSQLTAGRAWEPVWTIVGAGALASGPAAFAWSGDQRGLRRLCVCFGAVLALLAAGSVGSALVASAKTARTAQDLPLVLFRGGRADAPFARWQRDAFRTNEITPSSAPFATGSETYLKYLTPEGVVFITMHTHAGPCVDTAGYRCTVVGPLEDGQLRRYESTAHYGSYPRGMVIDALVYPDGSAVSVQGPDTGSRSEVPGTQSARTVLSSLERVDREAYEAATGAPLRDD